MAAGGRVLIGAIEGGGTKFICALHESALVQIERTVIPTTDPVGTLSACVEFLREGARRHGEIAAIGVACFGPLQLRPDAPDYGCLLNTPKEGWSGIDVLAPFREVFSAPLVIDTDVSAAAHGESRFGAGLGRGLLAYVTVGTGIGGAVAPATQASQLMHAEMGHLLVRRDARDAEFAGICPFHGDCLEGVASGAAILARWGCNLSQLPASHPGRAIISGYLSQLVVAITLLHSPEAIVLGGGVMSDGALLPMVREAARAHLAGYLPALREQVDLENLILAPALAGDSALAGTVQAALECLQAQERTS